MELRPGEPAIIVPVEVFGEAASRIIDMAVDTGATWVVIPQHMARGLGYDPSLTQRRMQLATASSVEVVPLITVRAVRALGFQVENVEVVCHDLPRASRVEGLLGLSFLKNFDIDMHFKQGRLELRDP